MAGASAGPCRELEGLTLLAPAMRMLLVEGWWNLHARGQESDERYRGCRHPHFEFDGNGFKCCSVREYGPAMRGAVIDGCCIERQPEKKLETTQSKCWEDVEYFTNTWKRTEKQETICLSQFQIKYNRQINNLLQMPRTPDD